MSKTTKSRESLKSQLAKQRALVDVDYSDITIRELSRMLSEDELNAAPTYQRKFRWTEKAESRLIESVLLGLPIPSLFVATNEDFTMEIVDGLQRLSTVVHFIGEDTDLLKQIGKPSPLCLSDLEKLPSLNGKTYSDLDEDIKLLFKRRTFRVTALSDKSNPEVRFDLFDRLNRGAVALSPQEVRACIYRGKFNKFIEELSQDSKFKDLVKLKNNNESDGTREELVLKFFAYLYYRESFKKIVSNFLNDYMGAATKSFNYAEGRRVWRSSIDFLHEILQGKPLLRPTTRTTPLNQFEAVLVGIGQIFLNKEMPVAPGVDWIEDPELVRASTGGTNSKARVISRTNRAIEIFSE